MATSYLDTTPIEQERLNPYISQFVPLPLNQLFRGGQIVQQRGEKNLADAYSSGDPIAATKARAIDEQSRAQIQEEWINQRDALLAENLNPSTLDFKRKQLALTNRYANDSRLRDISNLYAHDQQRKSLQADLRKKGKTVLDFQSDFANTAYDSSVGISAFDLENYGLEGMLDRHKAQQSYFDQMKADKGFLELARNNNIPYMLQNQSWEQISNSAIGEVATKSLNGYLQTDVGDQQFRDYVNLQGMTEDQARATIGKELLGTGQERQFYAENAQYTPDQLSLSAAKRQIDTIRPTSYFAGTLEDASTGEGGTVAPDAVGDLLGLTKSTNPSYSGISGIGQGYTITGNTNNFEIATKNGGTVSADVADEVVTLMGLMTSLGSTSEEIRDVRNIDNSWDAFTDGFTLLGHALANPLTDVGEGSWHLERELTQDEEAAKRALEAEYKRNPVLFNKAKNVLSREGFDKDLFGKIIGTKLIQSSGLTMDFVPSSQENNTTFRDGRLSVTGNGYITEDQLRTQLDADNANSYLFGVIDSDAENVVDELKDLGLVESRGTNENGENVFYIPGITFKGNTDLNSVQPRFDATMFDGSLNPEENLAVSENAQNRMIPIMALQEQRNLVMNAMDNRVGGDMNAFSAEQNRILSSLPPTASEEEKKKVKSLITKIYDFRSTGMNNREADLAFQKMMGYIASLRR